MPALMKASPYITVLYSNGIHTSRVVWTTHRGNFTPNIIHNSAWVYWLQLKEATAWARRSDFTVPTEVSRCPHWPEILTLCRCIN